MWGNCSQPNQFDNLESPESQGWLRQESGQYSIDWEAKEVQQQIQSNLDFLTKGCTCKTGCATKRCSCKKNGRSCGAGCECRGCKNLTLEKENDEYIEQEEDDEQEENDEQEGNDYEQEEDDELEENDYEQEEDDEQEDDDEQEALETEIVETMDDSNICLCLF